MVDVSRRGGPGVVKVVDALHAEAAGHLLVRLKAPSKIFEFDLFETHFACPSHIERYRSVRRHVVVRLAVCASAFGSVIDPYAQIVGVEDDFEGIPFVRPVRVVRAGEGRVRGQCAGAESSSCSTSSASARRRRSCRAASWVLGRGREESDRAVSPVKRLPFDLAALRVDCQGESRRRAFPLGQSHVNTLRSLRRLLRSEHHARPAAAGAAESRRELHVLKRLVEDEPAALRSLGTAYDLAVFRTPIGIAYASPCLQRRAVERPIRNEVFIGAGARQRQARRDYRHGCASDLFPHYCSPLHGHFGSLKAT